MHVSSDNDLIPRDPVVGLTLKSYLQAIDINQGMYLAFCMRATFDCTVYADLVLHRLDVVVTPF